MGKKMILTLIAVLTLAATPLYGQSKRINVAYSAISATQLGLYITKEAGLFEKNGLSADIIYVGSGTKVAQAVLAGQFPVALVGGVAVSANVAGGDIAFIGGVVNVPSFYLLVRSEIKKPEDLKGKALGITRYGSSTDFTLRFLLKKWGLEPDRDVKLIQMGGQPEIFAGTQSGVIQGGNFSSPTDYKARKAGLVELANLGKIGLDYPTVSIVSTRSYIAKDRDTPKKFLMAYTEGVQKLLGDKKFAIKTLSKYTRTKDPEILETSYAYSKNFIEPIPNLPYKAIETILGELAKKDPKAKGRKPEEFIDASFFKELEKNGFFKSVTR